MSEIKIHSYDTDNPVEGDTYDTAALQEEFTVEGFSAPYVVVRRKSDGQRGTLEFKNQPRVYFNFQPA